MPIIGISFVSVAVACASIGLAFTYRLCRRASLPPRPEGAGEPEAPLPAQVAQDNTTSVTDVTDVTDDNADESDDDERNYDDDNDHSGYALLCGAKIYPKILSVEQK